MGLFKKEKAAPQVQQTEYFTELGAPITDWEQRDQEITREQYDHLCTVLRTAEAIYCPFSLRTGEPYLYMDVLHDEEGYGFGRSRIQVWTEEENARLAPLFQKPEVEVVRIAAGEDGREIPAFLGMAFYENGAEYADINGVSFHVAAEDILPRPDLSQIPQHQRPAMNPQVQRWQCHLLQLAGAESSLKRDLEELYLMRLGNALRAGKLLLPLQVEGNPGEVGSSFSLPAWAGRNGREYVRVFTDWRRLRKGMDPKINWSANTETAGSLIKDYDLSLNSGLYINQALYHMICENQGN